MSYVPPSKTEVADGVYVAWSRFVGWAKKMWELVVEKLSPTKAEPSPTYEEWLASLPS